MERDLFVPIKTYFEALGYIGDGEVNNIDLYMEKDGLCLAVELKQTLDFKAVQQAALRQKVTDLVYIGIFKPKDMFSHAFRDKLYLLKRLGIGLLVVSAGRSTVELVNEPIVSELSAFQRRNKGERQALKKEFKKRKTKNNVGGVNGTKLITSYRENALLVLDAMMELGGQASTRQIREVSGVRTTTSILYNNYYGWFDQVSRGIYRVLEPGLDAVEEFTDTIGKLKGHK